MKNHTNKGLLRFALRFNPYYTPRARDIILSDILPSWGFIVTGLLLKIVYCCINIPPFLT